MAELINRSLIAIFSGGALFFVVFMFYSFFENEKKAILKALPLLFILVVAVLFFIYGQVSVELQLSVFIFLVVLSVVVLVPFGNKTIEFKIPENRFDERDVMFSRAELKEGTAKFDDYYRQRPQNLPLDNLFRKAPGLLNPKSKYYNPFIFNAADATFETVNLLQPLVEVDSKKIKEGNFTTEDISAFLKKWTIKLGAHSVGFTLLQPHHLYSYVGRGENYGNPVDLNHKYAIAFTVEMSHESLSFAPKGPVVMESSQQYLHAGTIAVQIAAFIRNLGFDARAHIDANYRVICPVVAQSAGLGTIGRMGILITPKLGARARIAVVTTDMELETVPEKIDSSVIDFCEICKKCAVNCPSNAISFNSSKTETGRYPWKINHEKCFTYWCKVGTDCGRCITVCPYSHPNNFIHNIIRWMIKQNPINRWLALKLDNYFYGEKPGLLPSKNWMGLKNGTF